MGVYESIIKRDVDMLNNLLNGVKPATFETAQEKYQQIFYGAPGTGKSFEINRLTKDKEVIRTTFHPDSDYSTFVGAYKPTTIEVPLRDLAGHIVYDEKTNEPVLENRVVYDFVEQAFLQAYTKAWKAYANAEEGMKPTEQYLIIEEINRGNCAQIFGDLFQLLDRNSFGFSDYPITADKDMKKQLATVFMDLTIANADRINSIYDKDVVSQVLSGEILLLPDNLFIWATMNTSDQSLFPIDSAFKRRWDWKYIPISEGKTETGERLGWRIKVGGNEYDWCQFMNKINHEIGEITKSEDKKIGYFFCKAEDGIISAETFVSKVIFYLWNDVFKDQDVASIFNDGDDELKFSDFYDTATKGKAIIREDKIEVFLKNLELEPIAVVEDSEESNEDKNYDEEDNEDNDYAESTRDYSKYSINGEGKSAKRHVPTKVMTLYVRNNPDANAQEILGAWNALQLSPQRFYSEDEYNKRKAASGDQYFSARYDEVPLANGEKIYVYNQIGITGMTTFAEKVNAQPFGIHIEKVE